MASVEFDENPQRGLPRAHWQRPHGRAALAAAAAKRQHASQGPFPSAIPNMKPTLIALLLLPPLLTACSVSGFYAPLSIPMEGPPADIHPSSPWYQGALPAGPHPRSDTPRYRARRSGLPPDGIPDDSPSGNRTWRERGTGQITGSQWTSPAGNTTYRDSSGRITGSSSESPESTTTYRDDRGRIDTLSSSSGDGGGGNTTTYRRDGVIVGNKYVSPAGNTTWRDGSGQIIDGPGEMKP